MCREIQYLAKSIADEPFNSKTSESIQFYIQLAKLIHLVLGLDSIKTVPMMVESLYMLQVNLESNQQDLKKALLVTEWLLCHSIDTSDKVHLHIIQSL